MSKKIHSAKSLYLEGIRDGKVREAVEKHTGDRYTQHSTGVRDGVEGFVAFFEPFVARNPIRDIDLVRAFEDGQYVFVHAYQSLNNGESKWVTMDFFDTDADDKIIEHWDVITEYKDQAESGRTQVDGPTEIENIADTQENKALVRSMIQDLLMPGGDVDAASHYISQDYTQHTLDLPDGLEPFLQSLKSSGRSFWYSEIVLLVGCGNFVATLCRATRDGQEYAQTDLFRVENGKIIEHWDAAEPVPADADLANGGKF